MVKQKQERQEVITHTAGIMLGAGDVTVLLQNLLKLDDETRSPILRQVLKSFLKRKGAYPSFAKPEATSKLVPAKEQNLLEPSSSARSFPDTDGQDFAYSTVCVWQARAGAIDKAQEAAKAIEGGLARYFAYRAIGGAQAEAGFTAGSAASFGVAFEAAQKFEANTGTSEMRDIYLSALAIDQASAGDIGGARRTVEAMAGNQSFASSGVHGKMVNEDLERRWALYYIAKAEARAGKTAEAMATARSITPTPAPSQILLGAGVVAEGLAEGGRTAELLSSNWAPDALAMAVVRYIAAGNFSGALQIADAITNSDWKAHVLALIAEAQSRAD